MVPGGIRYLRGHLPGELSFSILGKARQSDVPSVFLPRASHDADPDTTRAAIGWRSGAVLTRRLRVLDGGSPYLLSRRHSRLGGAGHEDSRFQLRSQPAIQSQVLHLVELPLDGNRPPPAQQPLDDPAVLDHPLVSPV